MTQKAKIEIYTRPGCGFCGRAKNFLAHKKLTFQEYDIWDEISRNREMIKRSGGKRTVPQIFINDQSIGGCNELLALDANQAFDPLLE